MKYIIIDGVFRDTDGSIKGPGQSIELDESSAALHATSVRLDAVADVVQTPALETLDPALTAS